MKTYAVYIPSMSCPLTIVAEKMITHYRSTDFTPIKITFVTGDKTFTEFYANNISGWKELIDDENDDGG